MHDVDERPQNVQSLYRPLGCMKGLITQLFVSGLETSVNSKI
jgi:hypothetical protein